MLSITKLKLHHRMCNAILTGEDPVGQPKESINHTVMCDKYCLTNECKRKSNLPAPIPVLPLVVALEPTRAVE